MNRKEVIEILEGVAELLELDNDKKLVNLLKLSDKSPTYLVSIANRNSLSATADYLLNEQGACDQLREAARYIKTMDLLDL